MFPEQQEGKRNQSSDDAHDVIYLLCLSIIYANCYRSAALQLRIAGHFHSAPDSELRD